MKKKPLLFYPIFLLLISCGTGDESAPSIDICPTTGLLETFDDPDGHEFFIYEDGKAYTNSGGECRFEVQYFASDFLEANYVTNSEGTFLIIDANNLLPTKSTFMEGFEGAVTFADLFKNAGNDNTLYWTNFTLQSPATPELADYVSLSKCIVDGDCSFIDNKIELVEDPSDASNTVLKFTSVPPSEDMVTSKTSITSTLNYYLKNSEIWFEASYFIESGMPYSIVDFENSYFLQSPGPRVVIRNNRLDFENKFGAKLIIENNSGITISQNEWFTLKVHLKFSNEQDGIIELWQDGVQIISTTGINLPTANSIQNVLEVGVTASTEGCILLLDNLRISETSF